jgi:hypothetical protein
MKPHLFAMVAAVATAVMLGGPAGHAQTHGQKERFTAIAIVNNNLGSGAGTVQIDITRWSTTAERDRLLDVLQTKGAAKLLDALQETRPVGRIKTPDSLGYDLHYAQQTLTEDGGRRIVIATDRPIGFWELTNNARTVDYPFTVIQMEIGRDGRGKGTLSYATKVVAAGKNIFLENFATSPVMLTEVRSDDSE